MWRSTCVFLISSVSQLLLEVWEPKAAGDEHDVRVYMTHLRGDPGGSETEAGVGYRLEWDGA